MPVAHGFFDQPHAVDVFQETRAALEAAFVADVLLEGRFAEAGAIEDGAHERPCSGTDERTIVTGVRNSGDSRARIVTRGCDQLSVSECGELREFSFKFADDRAGGHKFRRLALVKACRPKNLRRPGAIGGTDELRVRRQRELRDRTPAETAENVFRQIQPARAIGQAGNVIRDELVQRVEAQHLNAGNGVEALYRKCFPELRRDFFRARIAIAERILQGLAVAVHAHIVNGPAIHADGIDRTGGFTGGKTQTFEKTLAQAGDAPIEMSIALVRAIVEAVNDPQSRALGLPVEQGDSATLCAEVNGDYAAWLWAGTGRIAHRRKASLRPPSTGNKWPVVQRARGLAKKRIALAQSSVSIAACIHASWR